MQYTTENLFVIDTSWFDNPFDGIVYTDLEEAERLASEHNIRNNIGINYASYAKVFSISDYIEKREDDASSRAMYD